MPPPEPNPRPPQSRDLNDAEESPPDLVTIAQQIVQASTFIRTQFCTLTLLGLHPNLHKRLRDTTTRLMAYPWVLVDESNPSKPFHSLEDLHTSPTAAIAAMEDLERFFARDRSGANTVEMGLARDLLFAARFTRLLCTPPEPLGLLGEGYTDLEIFMARESCPPSVASLRSRFPCDLRIDSAALTNAGADSDKAAENQDARDD